MHPACFKTFLACTTVSSGDARAGRVHRHFVGLIHKTVTVLMFWRELKQFACIQSQCHRKQTAQQCMWAYSYSYSGYSMSIYPLSAANTRRSTDAGYMLPQRLRRYTNINQALVQITAVFVVCLVVIRCLL